MISKSCTSFLTFFTILLMLLVYGCAPETRQVTVPAETPEEFSKPGAVGQAVPQEWWRSFDNDRLNALVDTALQQNFTLKTAWERLQASEAVIRRESASFFPTLDGTGSANVNRSSDAADSESFSLGLSSTYELDLWGRIRSSVEAESFRAEASKADYQTAALTISAEITRTWFRLVEEQQQRQLLNEQLETNQTVLSLLEARFGSGQIRSVDILRQRQLVEATREQLTNVDSRIAVLEHQMAVLLGRSPQNFMSQSDFELPDLPPLPQTGVPADLVQRRPDVQIAFNELKAADRDLAAAISNRYPRITLSASLNTAADNAANLFQEWALSFGGNMIAPILRGRELSAEADRVEAVKKQRLYEYGQTVLIAFQEVENALIQEQKQKQNIASIRKQLKLARQSYEQLRLEYFNGISNYLDVLTALDEVQRLQRDLLSARLTLVEYRIALYRALAGPFETPRGNSEV